MDFLSFKKVGSFFAIVPPCMGQNPRQTLTKCRMGLKMHGKITIGIITRNSPWRKFFAKKMERAALPREGFVFILWRKWSIS